MAHATINGSEPFKAKMAIAQPSYNKELHGLVDMGSNGIRFSISDLSAPRSRLLPCIYAERAGISLYDDLSKSQSEPTFSPGIIAQVAETLGRFKGICDKYDVPERNIIVFATEAMRKATNKDDMLKAIKKNSGLDVEIIEGPMESLFGAMGARSGYGHVDGLFMDLGGGSVQMTYMNSNGDENYGQQSMDAARSLPYGAARVTSHLESYQKSDVEELKDSMSKNMTDTFNQMTQKFPRLSEQLDDRGVTIYLCGGGFRGYGSMLMHTDPVQPYPIPAIGGYIASGARFSDWHGVKKAHKESKKVFGMSKSRHKQFPAILLVIRAIVHAVPKIKEVIFCSGGNREGVLFMKLPIAIREQSPFLVLPGGFESSPTVLDSIADTLAVLLPIGRLCCVSRELLLYVAKNIWEGTGDAGDINCAKAVHSPTSGPLAGLPGFTHKTRAAYAIIMCERWGVDFGPNDQKLFSKLEELAGSGMDLETCKLIGTAARLLVTLSPSFPKSDRSLYETVRFSWEKNGNSEDELRVHIAAQALLGVDEQKLHKIISVVRVNYSNFQNE